MKWVLVGHRGVGKTQLLKRFESYFKATPELKFFDLDHQIELKYRKPIQQLFPEVGEESFRKIEGEVFNSILQNSKNFIISVGAGFSSQKLVEAKSSHQIKVIWIRRKTDSLGRIFFGRPRLNLDLSPLQEFQERFAARQKSYQESASEVYWMPEGITKENSVEEEMWVQGLLQCGGVLTLLPWHFKECHFLRYGCDFFEIRDDLISLSEHDWQKINFQQRLLSLRTKNSTAESLPHLAKFALSDWALELGSAPTKDISMISAHEYEKGESLGQFLIRLEKAGHANQALKASPVIHNYLEASELLEWQLQNPQMRSILPRTPKGEDARWMWMRLYMKARQKINFWRDSDGSAEDQPSLFEWMSSPVRPNHFAVLFGDPVFHSKTMVEQFDFFNAFKVPIWPIRTTSAEFAQSFEFLRSKGLIAAAVTSPLKAEAFQISKNQSAEAQELEATNTLFLSSTEIYGHNTDLIGFKRLCEKAKVDFKNSKVAVWGGGGTLKVIQKVFPQAIAISVRTRQARDLNIPLPKQVDILIWAAGPRDPLPPEIDFSLLIDLNYREDSQARELALLLQKRYVGGDEMFLSQAEAQRRFWSGFKISE